MGKCGGGRAMEACARAERDAMPDRLGGKRLSAASNIVFSNGLQDPSASHRPGPPYPALLTPRCRWHGGGVLKNISDSMPAVIIEDGAHHVE